MVNNCGIYKIVCITNNKIYIGSSIELLQREIGHFRRLLNNNHHSIHLQRAWNKYGKENFKFEILELINQHEEESRIDFKVRLVEEREQYYLDTLLFANENDSRFFELGYNICRKAKSPLGVIRSQETKEKLSRKLIGRKLSKDHVENIVKSNIKTREKRGFWHSEETIKKMKNRIVTLEDRERTSKTFKGKSKSEAHKENLRIARGKVKRSKHTEETKIKMSNTHKGKPKSEAHKKSMSISRKGRVAWNKGIKSVNIQNSRKAYFEKLKQQGLKATWERDEFGKRKRVLTSIINNSESKK